MNKIFIWVAIIVVVVFVIRQQCNDEIGKYRASLLATQAQLALTNKELDKCKNNVVKCKNTVVKCNNKKNYTIRLLRPGQKLRHPNSITGNGVELSGILYRH